MIGVGKNYELFRLLITVCGGVVILGVVILIYLKSKINRYKNLSNKKRINN